MNKIYTALCCLALMLGTSFSVSAQSDACVGALGFMITPGVPVTSTTVGSTFDNVGTCNTSNTAPGVWYSVIGTGGILTLETCGGSTNYDTKLSVFTGSCGALTCVAGNDDACSLQSRVIINTTPGTIYYVLVHGFSSATGTFTLSSSITSVATNDFCANATPINCGGVATGSTAAATFDNVGTCGTSNTSAGVWYQLVGTGGLTVATTCGAGSNYDTKISVFSGSCGSLTCVTGNDDDFTCGFSSLRSSASWNAAPGQVYYILVHGFGSSTGNFELSIDCPSPPANDNVCNADPINIGTTYTTDNRFATAQSGEVYPGAGTGTSTCNSQDGWCSFESSPQVARTLWYTFQAPASGCVTISTSGWDSQLALWSATNCNDFSTFTEIAANDDGGPGLAAQIDEASCLTPGATYYIQVDGYGTSTSANGTLVITDCGGTPLSVDAGECQTRFVGYSTLANDTNFLLATASGGLAPYTYDWQPSADVLFQSGPNAAVQPSATTTYTVTVTDQRGCTATDQVTVVFEDLACANNKVNVCHVPPGNPANAHNICISVNAVQTHLNNHGDYLGSCSNTCRSTNPSVSPPPACVDVTVNVTTDNFGSETSWTLTDQTTNLVVAEKLNGDYTSNNSFSDTYCLDPTHCYTFNIEDSFGDGICCFWGTGSWNIDFNGTVTNSPSGGAFGSSETVNVGQCSNKGAQPAAASILENELMVVAYPNPASGYANFKFSAPQSGNAVVSVYTLTGNKVAELFNGQVEAGVSNAVEYNTSDLPAGIYVYRIFTNSGSKAGKLQIVH